MLHRESEGGLHGMGRGSNFDSSLRLEGRMTSQWSSTLNSIRDGETDKTGGRERERWTYFILDSVDDGEGERGRSPGEGEREERRGLVDLAPM